MNLPWLILASASPRRAELLRQLTPRFEIIPGQAEEIHATCLSPHELCQANAYRKARAVADSRPEALVLGADTLVCLGQEAFGKPRDLPDAQRMLACLSGHTHQVVTGVCLVQRTMHRQRNFAVSTLVKFRPLPADEIRSYLRLVNPLDKAGAYAIQEHGALIIEQIIGSFSNVVGLPLERLGEELAAWPQHTLARHRRAAAPRRALTATAR